MAEGAQSPGARPPKGLRGLRPRAPVRAGSGPAAGITTSSPVQDKTRDGSPLGAEMPHYLTVGVCTEVFGAVSLCGDGILICMRLI